MAWNKHLDNADYKRVAQAIVDEVEWLDEDLVTKAFAITTDRLGHQANEAELGEIWTHVIGLDTKYAILVAPDTEDRYLALGTEVQYDEPEPEHGFEKPTEPDCDTGQ